MLVSVAGDENEAEQSLKGLSAAGGYIRHELVSRLGIRQAPELIFVLDHSTSTAAGSKSCCIEFRKGSVRFELGSTRMLDEVLNQIGRRQTFILTSHARPDGDAVGSALACCQILRSMGKQANVVLSDGVPGVYRPLPFSDSVLQTTENAPQPRRSSSWNATACSVRA